MSNTSGLMEPEWLNDEDDDARRDNRGPLFVMRERLSYLDLSGRVNKGPVQSNRGGYSDVFKGTLFAEDGGHRLVAVKELRVHIMKERNLQRSLARELYIWSKLNHPNILPFYGFYIKHNIYPHLIAPWMNNGTVMKYLEANPAADAMPLIKGIAEGIRYLHANEIIHSDIKPDNILISDSEIPQLCDFGVSRIRESSMTFQTSTTSTLRGTLRYTAREIILSEDGVTNSKEADIWAFGMTIYTILTRNVPYYRITGDAAVILAIVNGRLPSWPEGNESWSPAIIGLQAVCESCWLEKPDRPTMGAVIPQLNTLEISHIDSCANRCLECLNVLRSQLKFNLCDIESSHLRNTGTAKLKSCMEDRISDALRSASLRWGSYVLDFYGLRKPVRDFLSSQAPLYWIEIMSLLGELESAKRTLRKCMQHFEHDDKIHQASINWSTFIDDFYDAISVSAPHVYISALSWGAPNSLKALRERRLLVSDNSGNSGPQINILDDAREMIGKPESVLCISFSTDGSKFASGHKDGSLQIWNAATGELIHEVLCHEGLITDLKFSPDGSKVATRSQDGELRIRDVQTGDLVSGPLMGNKGWVWTVAFSPDGNMIVSDSMGGVPLMWDAQTGQTIGGRLLGHTKAVYTVSYSPDGERIVSGSTDNTLRIWDARSGEQIGQPLIGHGAAVWSAAYSPDGSKIVSGSDDKTVRIWDAQTGRPIGEPLIGHEGYVWSVGYTPDGSRIISGSRDNTLRIWDASSQDLIGVIPRGESRWDSVRKCFLSIRTWLSVPNNHWRAPPTIESLIHSDAPIQIPDSGWLRTLEGNLFLWVPNRYRKDLCCRGPTGQTAPRLRFDWKELPHGKEWAKIKEMIEESNEK